MTEQTAKDIFFVRIYRIETEDHRCINGLVEALDGSGICEPFASADELALLLHRRIAASGNRSKKQKKKSYVKCAKKLAK